MNMPPFSINLIRDMVPNRAKRRRMLVLALLYLVVFGSVAVIAASVATHRLVEAYHQRRTVNMLEWDYHKAYQGSENMAEHGAELLRGLEGTALRLDTVQSTLQDRARLSGALYALQAPLPHDVHLVSLELDRKKKGMQFDIMMPAESSADSRSTQTWIQQWGKNRELQAVLKNIKPSVSQRQILDETPVVILRFTAIFLGNKD